MESQYEVEEVEIAVELGDRSHNQTDQENPKKVCPLERKNKVSSSKPLAYDEAEVQIFSDDDVTLKTAQHCLVT